MNNTFIFKRFNQMLAYDRKRFIRNFGITLLVWIGMPVMFWVTSLVFGFDIDPSARIFIIFCLIVITVMTAPARIYGKVNLPREGVSFAMLPATSLEKFVSMFLYCSLLTPALTLIGAFLVDCLMSLLPFGGFKEFIPLMTILSDVSFNVLMQAFAMLGTTTWAVSSFFMFGNMLFKRRKGGKTFGWALLIMFTIVLLMELTDGWRVIDFIFDDNNDILNMVIYCVIMMLTACGFYFGTYRKIKTQKY